MSWDKYVKKYVWDDDKTPYFTPAQKLNKSQADSELLAYTVFVTLLFGILSLVFLTDLAPQGRSPTVAFYALSVACAAVFFGMTKNVVPATYLGAAPLVVLVYFFFFDGFPPDTAEIDKLVLTIIALVFLRYSLRIVAIARHYQAMPEGPKERKSRKTPWE